MAASPEPAPDRACPGPRSGNPGTPRKDNLASSMRRRTDTSSLYLTCKIVPLPPLLRQSPAPRVGYAPGAQGRAVKFLQYCPLKGPQTHPAPDRSPGQAPGRGGFARVNLSCFAEHVTALPVLGGGVPEGRRGRCCPSCTIISKNWYESLSSNQYPPSTYACILEDGVVSYVCIYNCCKEIN